MLTSGGLDAIDASVLEPFEYAALGHIHGAQKVGQERFCYCGTPYKYSISEEHHQKGITVVELGEKGSEPQIRRLPILCHPNVKRVRGTLEELKLLSDTMEKMPDGSGRADAYVSVVLTDEKKCTISGNAWRSYLRIFWRSGWTMRGRGNDWRKNRRKKGR